MDHLSHPCTLHSSHEVMGMHQSLASPIVPSHDSSVSALGEGGDEGAGESEGGGDGEGEVKVRARVRARARARERVRARVRARERLRGVLVQLLEGG